MAAVCPCLDPCRELCLDPCLDPCLCLCHDLGQAWVAQFSCSWAAGDTENCSHLALNPTNWLAWWVLGHAGEGVNRLLEWWIYFANVAGCVFFCSDMVAFFSSTYVPRLLATQSRPGRRLSPPVLVAWCFGVPRFSELPLCLQLKEQGAHGTCTA